MDSADRRGRRAVAGAVVVVLALVAGDVLVRSGLGATERAAAEDRAAAAEADAATATALDRLGAATASFDSVTAAAAAAEAGAAAARAERDAVEADLAAAAADLDAARDRFAAELTAGAGTDVVAALGRCLRSVRQALVAVGVDDAPFVEATLRSASVDCSAAESMAVRP